MAGKCEVCLFAGDDYACRKTEMVKQAQAVYAGKIKALMFLGNEAARLDKIHCIEEFDGQLSFTLCEQQENAVEDFEGYLRKWAVWANEQPLSVLRRKYPAATSGLFPLRVHCRWKKCQNQACQLRRRGRHCRKQKK